MSMETLSYGAFSQTMHRQVIADKVPLSVTIEITRRCPLTCAHCYNNLPMNDKAARLGELTYAEHCRILDEMAEAGSLFLLYTGGEILARRDFLDIYTHAQKKGLLITLFTNGTMITPKVADYFVEWLPFAIEITLYGRTKETYEGLTGIPGSYERCLQGIELLRERGLPLALKSVAVTLNKHELADMQQFAEELGLAFKFDAMMNPRIDCSQSPLEVRLSPEECVALDLGTPKRMDEWRVFQEEHAGPVHTPKTADDLYHCGGGVDSFAISPSGQMSICVLSQNDLYDLRTGSVRDGWGHFLRSVRARKITRPTKCVTCELKSSCGMCPANGELENGDAEAPVEFLCHAAHLRAYTFGMSVPPHGECEFCEGGSRHEELMQSVTRLHTGESNPAAGLGRGPMLLPMATASGGAAAGGCGSGGCASCH